MKLGGLYEYDLMGKINIDSLIVALNRSWPFHSLDTSTSKRHVFWKSPEAHSDQFQGSKKDDIWCLGSVFVHASRSNEC